jgi:hypothetical protein
LKLNAKIFLSHPKSSIGLRVVFQSKVQIKTLGNDDKLKEAWSLKLGHTIIVQWERKQQS